MGRRSRLWQAGSRRDPGAPHGEFDWVRPSQLAAAATVVFGPLHFTAAAGRARDAAARADQPPPPTDSDSGHPVLLQ